MYKNIDCYIGSTHFIETKGVPSDAIVVGHTWRYLNKNGTPDRRFNNNHQIPICNYSEYTFYSSLGLYEKIATSKLNGFDNFIDYIMTIGQLQKNQVIQQNKKIEESQQIQQNISIKPSPQIRKSKIKIVITETPNTSIAKNLEMLSEIDILRKELELIETYPNSFAKINCEINGIGFFPGAKGIWNYDTEHTISDKPIMIVGNDFGAERDFGNSVTRGKENLNGLTWRNLIQMLDAYGIDKEKCFFTNAIMGVRKDVSAIGRSPAFNEKDFLHDCKFFLIKQIELQKPKLIIIIGLQTLDLISELSPDLSQLKNIKSFKQLDEGNFSSFKNVQISNVNANFVFLTHPTYWHLNIKNRSIKGLYGIDAEKALLSPFISNSIKVQHETNKDFLEKLGSLFFHFEYGFGNDPGIGTHLLITNIENDFRKATFYEYLSSLNWKEFIKDIHQEDKADYNYVIIRDIDKPIDLYNAFYLHNTKIIIFDLEKVLSSKWYTTILEGGVCSSPDSCRKWNVSYDGKNDFIFSGRCIILTSQTLSDLKKIDRMEYIIRDTFKSGD